MNEVVNTSTVPIIKEERPVLDTKQRQGMKDRVPMVYDWKHGKAVYPSKRETILLNAWCETFNYAECCRRYEGETGYKLDPMTCRRWMARGHVQEAVAAKLREGARARGYTKDHWLSEGIGFQENGEKDGVKFHQMIAWKELGRACGFYVPDVVNQNNVQINIVQADGRA